MREQYKLSRNIGIRLSAVLWYFTVQYTNVQYIQSVPMYHLLYDTIYGTINIGQKTRKIWQLTNIWQIMFCTNRYILQMLPTEMRGIIAKGIKTLSQEPPKKGSSFPTFY